MAWNEDVPLGQRIAALRKMRGLTQQGLALRLNRSTSWVTKIERGVRRIDSMAVLYELARALAVPVRELTNHVHQAADERQTDDGRSLADLRQLIDRSVLDANRMREAAPLPLADQCNAATRLRRIYNTSPRNASAAAPSLARLIREAHRVVSCESGGHRSQAYGCLSTCYRLASLLFRLRGDFGRARLAIDRAVMSAEHADDPLLVASVFATLTVQLMIQGDPADAVSLAAEAAEYVGRQPQAGGPSGSVVLGSLYLYAAQAAARAGDGGEARRLLKVADSIATDLRHDREDYCLIFGPTNVAIQESGVLVDLGRPIDALRRAEGVRPERLGSVNRSAYYRLHLARAHGMRGEDDAAVYSVMAAHRIAPELVDHDPIARELILDVVRRRRRLDEPVRALARAMRVAT